MNVPGQGRSMTTGNRFEKHSTDCYPQSWMSTVGPDSLSCDRDTSQTSHESLLRKVRSLLSGLKLAIPSRFATQE